MITTEKPRPGVSLVRMQGPLDGLTSPELRSVLNREQYLLPRTLIADLSGVESVDSSGIGMLLGAMVKARRAGIQLRLICAGPVRRTLERSGVHVFFSLYSSPEEALGAERGRAAAV